jgi:hypothetical protein
MWLAPPLQINALSAVLILFFGFFFVTVSARITGEIGSSSNPISGMVVGTLLVTCLVYLLLGWTRPEDRYAALTTAAIVGIAASNGGTTAQDLKTAFLVGGTPRNQQIGLFVGVLTSALFIGGTLAFLNLGATVIVPEPHPGVHPAHLAAGATYAQLNVPIRLNERSMEAAGLTRAQLAAALWARGYELHETPSAATDELRSFAHLDPHGPASLELRTERGWVKLAALGELGTPSERRYGVGYARGEPGLPPGKYLLDADGQVQYVVDPGIGGRISEHLGQKLTRYDAPKARLFSLIIDGILTQQLPWNLVLLGVFLSLMLELCGVSSLPFAVGVYLPISTSAPIFVGGTVRHLVDRKRTSAESEFSPGTLLASGYIAGGSIGGVLLALLAIPGGGEYLGKVDLPALLHGRGPGWLQRFLNALWDTGPQHSPWISSFWAVGWFAVLVVYLAWTAQSRPASSGPQEPARTA